MTFREDSVGEFLAIFRDSKEMILGFDGCRHVELLQDVNEPNVYSTYSLWESEEHLNRYRDSELFGTVWKSTKVLFAAKPQAWSHRRVAV